MSRWHQPGATAVERAREVARTCWNALRIVDPQTADIIAWAASEAGETWLLPQIARHQDDDLVSVPEAAELVGKQARTVYEWVAHGRADQGRLPYVTNREGHIRIRVGTLFDYTASTRRSKFDS